MLGLTGLIDTLNRAIPKSVVRGLQLALGLSLLMKGLQMVTGTHAWIGADSYLTASIAALGVLALFSARVPSALVLFGAGLLLATWKDPASWGSCTSTGPSRTGRRSPGAISRAPSRWRRSRRSR